MRTVLSLIHQRLVWMNMYIELNANSKWSRLPFFTLLPWRSQAAKTFKTFSYESYTKRRPKCLSKNSTELTLTQMYSLYRKSMILPRGNSYVASAKSSGWKTVFSSDPPPLLKLNWGRKVFISFCQKSIFNSPESDIPEMQGNIKGRHGDIFIWACKKMYDLKVVFRGADGFLVQSVLEVGLG